MTADTTESKNSQSESATHDGALAYKIMHPALVIIPFGAGVDKFFNFITDWPRYVSPIVSELTHISPQIIMLASGPVEIAIGILVLLKPRIGALVFAGMLFGIMINLMTMPKQLHIAFLDCALALSSIAFATLVPGKTKK